MWSDMLSIAQEIALDVALTLAVMIPLLLAAAGTKRLAARVRAARHEAQDQER